jgi:copper(I)-binding protein
MLSYTVGMHIRSILAVLLGVLVLTACNRDVTPTPPKVGAVNAWIRLAPADAMMLAGYRRIDNDGEQPMRLRSVQSDAFGAIELHRTEVVDGVSRMREVPSLTIASGGSVVLEPGGMHLMLMQPQRALREGDEVAISFAWDQGESQFTEILPFVVRREAPAD